MLLQLTPLYIFPFKQVQIYSASYLRREGARERLLGAVGKGNSIKLLLEVCPGNFSRTTLVQASHNENWQR